MNALWDLGSGTVHDIIAALPQDDPPAYTTVLSIMQILTRKDVVRHEAEGRKHRYFPLIAREAARRHAAREFVNRFFGGSKELLMHSLVEEEDLDAETEKSLAELIEKIEE